MRFVPRPGALHEVRSSMPGVQAEVHTAAARVASNAGAGFSWDSQQGEKRPSGRWRAIVYPSTWAARQANARDNRLLRALSGGAAAQPAYTGGSS